jgi:EmrB/QacA subfamily drug resistance transporter
LTDFHAEEIQITQDNWVVPVLVALIGAFMSILDSSIVNVAISKIMTIFNATPESVEWVVTIYMLSLGVVMPLSAWLGDKLGLKRLYILSMVVFVAGSLLCSISWSLNSLIIARIIQAMGGGMIMPTMMSMVFRSVPANRVGGGMAFIGVALMVAPAIGPTLGGYLVEFVDWRWIFTINLPIGMIGIILAIFLLPEFPGAEVGKLDWSGFITSAIGLFCLLLALTKGNDWGWTSERIVLLFYISIISLALFIYLELTEESPLLDLRVFKYAAFTLSNLIVAITTIGLYAGIFYIPLFLQSVRGFGALEAGLVMMPGALISAAVMPVAGFLYDRIGPKVPLFIGITLLSLTTYLLHNLNLQTATATIVLWVIMRGMATSLANMPAQTLAGGGVPLELVGRASAITNINSRVSSSFGIAVFTSFLTKREIIVGSHMSSYIAPGNQALMEFLQKSGHLLSGSKNILGLVYLKQIVAVQAFVKGIDDIFLIISLITLVALIPVLLIKSEYVKRAGPMPKLK